MKKLIFLIILVATITGCSTKGIPIHGKFCGKNIPDISEKNTQKHIDILNKIKPIDEMDLACKKHDICYASKGFGNSSCDLNFISTATELSKRYKNPSCSQLAIISAGYFRTTNFSATREVWDDENRDLALKTLLTPLGIIQDARMAVLSGLMLTLNTASTAFADTIEFISPFPITRDKDIQYPMPSIHEKCW